MFEHLFTRREPEEQRRDLTCRTLTVRADTIDEEGRSVEAVMSTEGQVSVFDFGRWEVIDEVLVSSGAELPSQVPLLENHRRESLDNVLGSVRNMRIEGEQTVGRMFFAKDDARADSAWNKVRQGHLDAVSVGYRAVEFVDIAPNKTATVAGRTYTAGSRPLRITTQWQQKELSLTPVGADPRAKVRESAKPIPKEVQPMDPKLRKYLESLGLRADASEEDAKAFVGALGGNQRSICDVLGHKPADETATNMQRLSLEALGVESEKPWERKGVESGTTLETAVLRTAEPLNPPVDADAIRTAERERVSAIRKLAADDLDADAITRAIDEDWTVERTASAALEAIRSNRSAPVGAIHSRDHDSDCNVRSLAAGLLIATGADPLKNVLTREMGAELPRGSKFTEEDCDRGYAYNDMSAVDICREACRIDGGRVPVGRRDAIRAAVSGGTLAFVFGTNVYAKMVAGWTEIGDTTQGWVDEEDVANFLTQEDITLEASSRLERLPRGDTAKHATASDTRETYKIARYAKQFVIDEQDILDDRLGAMMAMPFEMGIAASRLRPNLIYNEILKNPNLVADSGAVFNATAVTTSGGHANLTTAVLASVGLKAAITQMGKQRGNESQVLNIAPRFLLVPAALEWTADELTKEETLIKIFGDSSDPLYSPSNAIARRGLTPVMDDRLGATGVIDPDTGVARAGSDTAWYLTAGGNRGIRAAYLRGTNRSPQLRSFALDRGQWGVGWDIKHDLGVAFLDFRPWAKSTGAG